MCSLVVYTYRHTVRGSCLGFVLLLLFYFVYHAAVHSELHECVYYPLPPLPVITAVPPPNNAHGFSSSWWSAAAPRSLLLATGV
jgi:hypothetical protein